MTDPIADMLTRIRNAVTAKHTRVDMPTSRGVMTGRAAVKAGVGGEVLCNVW